MFFSSLASAPLLELEQLDYTLHEIHLLQGNSTIPVGLKLTKQNDPLQYIITIVVKESRADTAGLKVDDWLVKLEDEDIRLKDFQQLSKDIQDSLNIRGLVNLVVARKKNYTTETFDADIKEQTTKEIMNSSNQNIELIKHKSNELINGSTDEIRHITLGEALGLDFNSYVPDDDQQVQVHFISNVKSLSMGDRAGLKDGDRILSINGADTAQYSHEEVRRMMSGKMPVTLTVVNEPKYLQLIRNVQENLDLNKITLSARELTVSEKKLKPVPEDLQEYFHLLFNDIHGPVYYKACRLIKKPKYDSFGFLLRQTNECHLIDAVEPDFPAYNSGLRENDVILGVNGKNAELLSHDELKKFIRISTNSAPSIDFILLLRKDLKRYKDYQEKNGMDWQLMIAQQGSNTDNQSLRKKL